MGPALLLAGISNSFGEDTYGPRSLLNSLGSGGFDPRVAGIPFLPPHRGHRARWRTRQRDVTTEALLRCAKRGVVPSPANAIPRLGLMVRNWGFRAPAPLATGLLVA